jgi:hypothetical protein
MPTFLKGDPRAALIAFDAIAAHEERIAEPLLGLLRGRAACGST